MAYVYDNALYHDDKYDADDDSDDADYEDRPDSESQRREDLDGDCNDRLNSDHEQPGMINWKGSKPTFKRLLKITHDYCSIILRGGTYSMRLVDIFRTPIITPVRIPRELLYKELHDIVALGIATEISPGVFKIDADKLIEAFDTFQIGTWRWTEHSGDTIIQGTMQELIQKLAAKGKTRDCIILDVLDSVKCGAGKEMEPGVWALNMRLVRIYTRKGRMGRWRWLGDGKGGGLGEFVGKEWAGDGGLGTGAFIPSGAIPVPRAEGGGVERGRHESQRHESQRPESQRPESQIPFSQRPFSERPSTQKPSTQKPPPPSYGQRSYFRPPEPAPLASQTTGRYEVPEDAIPVSAASMLDRLLPPSDGTRPDLGYH